MFRIELYGEILFGSRILFLKNSHTEKVLFEKLFLHKECDKRQWNRGDYGRWFKDILVEPLDLPVSLLVEVLFRIIAF